MLKITPLCIDRPPGRAELVFPGILGGFDHDPKSIPGTIAQLSESTALVHRDVSEGFLDG